MKKESGNLFDQFKTCIISDNAQLSKLKGGEDFIGIEDFIDG